MIFYRSPSSQCRKQWTLGRELLSSAEGQPEPSTGCCMYSKKLSFSWWNPSCINCVYTNLRSILAFLTHRPPLSSGSWFCVFIYCCSDKRPISMVMLLHTQMSDLHAPRKTDTKNGRVGSRYLSVSGSLRSLDMFVVALRIIELVHVCRHLSDRLYYSHTDCWFAAVAMFN